MPNYQRWYYTTPDGKYKFGVWKRGTAIFRTDVFNTEHAAHWDTLIARIEGSTTTRQEGYL